MAVITISREIYSNGSHIGEKVAEALGYHFADKKTIEKVFAEHSIFQFSEVYDTVLGFWERFDDMRSTTMKFLKQVIQALAHHGNMVIVGRGAFAVLGGFADVLNVRVQAPFALRAQRLMDNEKIADIDRARALLKERDRIRAKFIHSFFEVQWEDTAAASAFDLVIDTGKVPSDMAVRWLIDDGSELVGNFVNCLIPGNHRKAPVSAFERMGQALFVVLVVAHIEPLSADIPLAARVVLIGSYLDDTVFLDQHLEPAMLCAGHVSLRRAPAIFSFDTAIVFTYVFLCLDDTSLHLSVLHTRKAKGWPT